MTTAAPLPPPAKKVPPPVSTRSGAMPPVRDHRISSGVIQQCQKVVVFGCGGSGKTSLAKAIEQLDVTPLFLDLELGSQYLDLARIDTIQTWDDLRGVLHDQSVWQGFDAVVIDSLTKAEELATDWTLANVPHEKGHRVASVESYGYGKGTTHVYETFLQLLGDLDAHARAGRHVICTAHDCVANVPNPSGEDFIRWEPRLQSPASGKASIRHRVREWADHLLFIGYDVAVGPDGKGVGSGTRTIYPAELPTHMAKSRSLSEPIPYEKGSAELWRQLLNGRT